MRPSSAHEPHPPRASDPTFPGPVPAGDVALWVDQRGDGPDVLLLAGLSDPAESWTFQLEGLAGHTA